MESSPNYQHDRRKGDRRRIDTTTGIYQIIDSAIKLQPSSADVTDAIAYGLLVRASEYPPGSPANERLLKAAFQCEIASSIIRNQI